MSGCLHFIVGLRKKLKAFFTCSSAEGLCGFWEGGIVLVSNGVCASECECVCMCAPSQNNSFYTPKPPPGFFVVVIVLTKSPHFPSSLKQQLVLHVISESNGRSGENCASNWEADVAGGKVTPWAQGETQKGQRGQRWVYGLVYGPEL